MRRKISQIILPLLLLLSFVSAGQTEDPVFRRGVHYRFVLNNGQTLSGFVVAEDKEWITVEERPRLTRTDIRKSTITNVENPPLHEIAQDGGFGENRFADTYLAVASGLPFEPEEVTATAHWFFIDQTQYAFNKSWAFHVTSLTFYPFAAGLRCTYQVGASDHIGGGLSVFSNVPVADGNNAVFGYLVQGKWTHGTSNRNVTLSAGYLGLAGGHFYQPVPGKTFVSTPFFSAGFCNRLFLSWSVVLEGHALPDEGLMAGGAGMKLLRERSAWTFGCYGILAETFTTLPAGRTRAMPLPYIGYTWTLD